MPERVKMFSAAPRRLLGAIRQVWRLSLEVARKYVEDAGPLLAAAISFFTLLSVIPLVLLGVWGLGQFLSSAQAFRHVVDYLEAYLPGSGDILEPYLQALVKGRHTVGWVAFGGLAWSASQGFVILELAMNLALRVRARRSFVVSRLLGFGMILLAGGSLALSLLITSALTALRAYSVPLIGWQPSQIPALWTVTGVFVSTALTILSFTIIYRVMPNTRVRSRSALIAGTIAGLAWEIAKRAFTWYLPLATATAIKQVYGSVAGVIGLVVWIYYSSMILILGAELLSVLQNIHPKHPPRKAHDPYAVARRASGKRRR